MKKIIDISPTISPSIAVFPGDVAFTRSVSLDFQKGDHLTLSSITATLHLGAHADATNHYHRDGKGIAARDLNLYYGKCQVIRVKIKSGARIFPADLEKIKITAPRILFCTNSFPNPDSWNSDFNSLSPELVAFLAKKKVKLIGVDTPSVDPENSKNLESHNAIYKHKLAILEGLVLKHVKTGIYTLIALPLKIQNADASPVRAVLIP